MRFDRLHYCGRRLINRQAQLGVAIKSLQRPPPLRAPSAINHTGIAANAFQSRLQISRELLRSTSKLFRTRSTLQPVEPQRRDSAKDTVRLFLQITLELFNVLAFLDRVPKG